MGKEVIKLYMKEKKKDNLNKIKNEASVEHALISSQFGSVAYSDDDVMGS